MAVIHLNVPWHNHVDHTEPTTLVCEEYERGAMDRRRIGSLRNVRGDCVIFAATLCIFSPKQATVTFSTISTVDSGSSPTAIQSVCSLPALQGTDAEGHL